MKKYFIIILLFVASQRLHAQFFEGTINYAHYIEITDTTLLKQDMKYSLFFGSASALSIRNGDYIWRFANSTMESQMYLSSSGTIYEKFAKNDTLYTSHVANNHNEVIIQEEIKPSQLLTLNEKCQVMMVKSKFLKTGEKRIRMFYFSRKYPLSPDFYSRYKVNTNHMIFSKIKNLPLRFTIIYPAFRITYIATSIKQEKLDIKMFGINGKKTKPILIQK